MWTFSCESVTVSRDATYSKKWVALFRLKEVDGQVVIGTDVEVRIGTFRELFVPGDVVEITESGSSFTLGGRESALHKIVRDF